MRDTIKILLAIYLFLKITQYKKIAM